MWLALALIVAGVASVGIRLARHRAVAEVAATHAGARAVKPPGTTPRTTLVLRVRRLSPLRAPVQDAAVAALRNRAYAFGGLDASGASTTAISMISGSHTRIAGQLPVAIHDAAAASVGGRLYVLGGGQLSSYSGIATFDPATRRVRLVGALPTPLSDLATAVVGRTTYVVGGYTGASWSNRILGIVGGRSRVVGVLPVGLRYAAVAVSGGSLMIAGGRTASGPSRAIFRFSPATGDVTRVGSLPRPLMHAGAGVLGGVVYVVGGLTGAGAPVRTVTAIHPDGSVTPAARLPVPLSDAGVVTLPGRMVVIGGSTGSGPTRQVLQIAMEPIVAHTPATHPKDAAAPPPMFRGALPGDLLIADRGNNRMLIVNPRHKVLWRFPSRSGQAHLFFDDDTFFAPGGRRIISNQEDNHKIVEITYPAGRLVWSYGHAGVPGSTPGYLHTPDDAYALRNGLVIVADASNCRVLELRGRRIVRSIGQAGHCVHDPPRFLGPVNGDTPIPNGHILVSEIPGSYIDEFTLTGRLVRVYRAPVTYPSDPQLTNGGNILLADYTRPGGVVILDRRTGRLLWQYRVTHGWGMLDHPSLAAMLPNGMIALNDDYNNRVVVIDPHTKRIVWQYGHARAGKAPGFLNTPDGFDFIPVTATGLPDPAAIRHGR